MSSDYPRRNVPIVDYTGPSEDSSGSNGSRERPNRNTFQAAIEGADKGPDDEEVKLYYRPAGYDNNREPHDPVWMPASLVPPELIVSWAKQHIERLRSNRETSEKEEEEEDDDDDQDEESHIRGAKGKLNVDGREVIEDTIMVLYRPARKTKSGESVPYKWVPANTVPPDRLADWVQHKEREAKVAHDSKQRTPRSVNCTPTTDILTLKTLGEALPIPPKGPESPATALERQPSPEGTHDKPVIHFINANCDDDKPSRNVTNHTNEVAPCQSGKHFPFSPMSSDKSYKHGPHPYLVCKGCHQQGLSKHLTKDEQKHMITDKGLYSVCTLCAKYWMEEFGIESGRDVNNCTCAKTIGQWFCIDCWVELAKIRCRKRRDWHDCGCKLAKGQSKKKLSTTVRICSGCDQIVTKKYW